MLVRRDGVVVGQPAHAWVSGQLARAWGNDAFPAPEPLEPFCLAAEQHDVGWAEADLAPSVGPDGRPLGFTEIGRAAHMAIWGAAPRRLLAQSRYAALLVSLHGTSLYERVDEPAFADAIRSFVAGQRALQERLSQGLDPAEVDRNRRLLLTLDRMSLFLCYGSASELRDVPAAGGGAATLRLEPLGESRFTLDPWPFASPVVAVGCEGRLLEGSFASDAELRAALDEAAWVPLRWELSPG